MNIQILKNMTAPVFYNTAALVNNEGRGDNTADTVIISGSSENTSILVNQEKKPANSGTSSLAGTAKILLADEPALQKWQSRDVRDAAMGNNEMIYGAGKSFKSIDSSGSVTAEKPLGEYVFSPLLVTKSGNIIMSNRNGILFAIDGSGKDLWSNGGEARFGDIESLSESKDGTVYLMNDEHTLFSVDPSTGHVNWKFKHRSNFPNGTGSEVYSIPREGPDGTIYLGSHNNNIYAISPDGKKKWEYNTREWVNGTAAFSPDGATVYMGGDDGFLRALDSSGKLKWQSPKLGRIECEPAVGSDGTIYFGSYDKYFYAYNPDGSEKWKFETGKYMQCSPFISRDGTIYAGGKDGYLYAFNSDGGLRWKYDAKSPVKKIAGMSRENTLYIITDDRRLIAVDTDTKSVARKIAQEDKIRQDDKPEVITSDEWLIIGGVRLPVNKRTDSMAA